MRKRHLHVHVGRRHIHVHDCDAVFKDGMYGAESHVNGFKAGYSIGGDSITGAMKTAVERGTQLRVQHPV